MSGTELIKNFPSINFASGKTFVWSPVEDRVFYDPKRLNTPPGRMALLHEIGHAKLGHHSYELDTELIAMEVAAWEKAKELGAELSLKIDEEHVNQCLETYRVWLFKRSRCPHCENTGLQSSPRYYYCFLCGSRWQVAPTHSLQPRRMKCNIPQN